MHRAAPIIVLIATGVLAPSVTYAQVSNTNQALARRLYADAKAALEQENYSVACPEFEQALDSWRDNVRIAISVADCYRQWGKLETALRDYQKARELATQQNDQAKVNEIDARVTALAPRVPRLRILVSSHVKDFLGAGVSCDGTPVPENQWGKQIYVDPGDHQIEVWASGQKTWTFSIHVPEGQLKDVTIAPNWILPTKSSTPQPSPPPTVNRTNPPDSVVDETVPPKKTKAQPPLSSTVRTVGTVGVALGLLGVILGAAFGGISISKEVDSKKNWETSAIGTGVAGGVLLVGGIVLVVSSPPSKSTNRPPPVLGHIWIGPSSVGLSGRW